MIFFDIDATLLDHKHAEQMGAIEFLNVNNTELKLLFSQKHVIKQMCQFMNAITLGID